MMSQEERNIVDKLIYFPLLLVLINMDLKTIESENSSFKIKAPYITLLNNTIQNVSKDLRITKEMARKKKLKVLKINQGDLFTTYLFIIRRCEEKHRYFNIHIKNQVQILLNHYLNSA